METDPPNSDQISDYWIKAQRHFFSFLTLASVSLSCYAGTALVLQPVNIQPLVVGHHRSWWFSPRRKQKDSPGTVSPSQLILPVLLGPWPDSHFPGSRASTGWLSSPSLVLPPRSPRTDKAITVMNLPGCLPLPVAKAIIPLSVPSHCSVPS